MAWAGIQSEIAVRISDGSLGASYPDTCSDGGGAIGTDQLAFWNAMRFIVPSLQERPWLHAVEQPSFDDVMDLIEFCWRAVGKP